MPTSIPPVAGQSGEGRALETPSSMGASRLLHRLVTGYQVSQAVHVAATLGLCDLLADGPRSVAELAVATGADARSLTRLMRALAAVGLYVSDDNERFANTELGDAFRADASRSVAGWARFVGRPYHWQTYALLEYSVRTGENAFAAVHGESVWDYLAKHPDEQRVFDEAMTALSEAVAEEVVDAYDFGRFGTVVDVGGGRGMLLAAVLSRFPSVDGVLFDQPDVVAGAHELLSAAGVSQRCRVVGGSFFDSVPERRRRIPAQVGDPRLAGRRVRRDPARLPALDAGARSPAVGGAAAGRVSGPRSDGLLRPHHARRGRWPGTYDGRVPLAAWGSRLRPHPYGADRERCVHDRGGASSVGVACTFPNSHGRHPHASQMLGDLGYQIGDEHTHMPLRGRTAE